MKYDTLIQKLSERISKLEKSNKNLERRCEELEEDVLEAKIHEVPIFPVFLEEADLHPNAIRWAN